MADNRRLREFRTIWALFMVVNIALAIALIALIFVVFS
jgi:hypothetical protein